MLNLETHSETGSQKQIKSVHLKNNSINERREEGQELRLVGLHVREEHRKKQLPMLTQSVQSAKIWPEPLQCYGPNGSGNLDPLYQMQRLYLKA